MCHCPESADASCWPLSSASACYSSCRRCHRRGCFCRRRGSVSRSPLSVLDAVAPLRSLPNSALSALTLNSCVVSRTQSSPESSIDPPPGSASPFLPFFQSALILPTSGGEPQPKAIILLKDKKKQAIPSNISTAFGHVGGLLIPFNQFNSAYSSSASTVASHQFLFLVCDH